MLLQIHTINSTCVYPWDNDTKRAQEPKASRYADLKIALSNEVWDCSRYLMDVGARGHIFKSVKDRLWSLLRVWIPVGHRSGIAQIIKDVSCIYLECSFFIFQACNDPVWSSPRLVTRHIDGVPMEV
jgi:hypothetical protein